MGTMKLREPGTGELGSAAVGVDGAGRSAEATGADQEVAARPAVSRADAERCLALLGDTLSQMSQQGVQLHRRVEELSTLFDLSTLLAGQGELRNVLDTVVRNLVQVMDVNAAAIRLVDKASEEMRIEAVHNLSPSYLNKGTILLSRSPMDQSALRGEVVEVRDMANDPRVLYPEDARREGLASILSTGMIYRGKPIGVMRVYTAHPRKFTNNEKNLLRAIAQLAAAAIRNAQLDAERQESQRIQRQVQLAADVQRRLLPQTTPECPPFEVAGRYEPCFELGGDFYDFIPLQDSLGVLLGDVVGKGVAASLLMASVRASFRAHVEDIYDIDEVMAQVNNAMTRDSRDNEFATVFYGTLDRRTLRLTYCSAGHEPGLLVRNGEVRELNRGGMALGIDASQTYNKALVDLAPGDALILYSDGITDASNFAGERFGRHRVRQAAAAVADGSANDIVNHLLWEMRRFVGLNRRPDDVTLVAVKVASDA
jgi:sigma-B regulation protein RsbU (phosphoserine phosphatase)